MRSVPVLGDIEAPADPNIAMLRDIIKKTRKTCCTTGMTDQAQMQANGNRYLQKAFPDLDFIKKATIEPAAAPAKK